MDIFWSQTFPLSLFISKVVVTSIIIICFKLHVILKKKKAHFFSAYRCQASWDYILEKCDVKMAPQILDITDKICSSAQKQMSHTVKRIVKGLERSVFFKSVLPSFIHSMTKEDKNR